MASKGADFFPVAKGVQVPFVGKEEVKADPVTRLRLSDTEKHKIRMGCINQNSKLDDLNEKKQKNHQRTLKVKDKSKGEIDENYLKLISAGLSFSEDVIDERARNGRSYSPNERGRVFKELKKSKTRKDTVVGGRHDSRYSVEKHYPCFLKNPVLHTVENSVNIGKMPLPRINSKKNKDVKTEDNLAKVKSIEAYSIIKPQISWDEYLMSLLSKETAEMVIKEFTTGTQQSKLNDLISRSNGGVLVKKSDKKFQVEQNPENTRKQSDLQVAKQPREEDEKLFQNGQIKKGNLYSKEMTKGALPLHAVKGNPNNIVLDTQPNHVFGKVLETSYPAASDNWYDWKSRSKKQKYAGKKKVMKGMHKWKNYPELMEDEHIHKMTLSAVTPVQSYVELDSKTVKQQREDANLIRIVEEWRGKWFLEKKWESSSDEQLLDGMCDINDHVRLSAVSACSKAFLQKKITETNAKAKHILLSNDSSEFSSDVTVSPQILQKIYELLSDRCLEVQVASAITLFALNKANQKAKEILLGTLTSGGPPEKWAAAQCLAYAGCDADAVVTELISNINLADLVKHSKAVKLLSRLSKQSTTVQYTLAEQLNSSSWRDRVVACQVFPSLQGPLSKDIANKISHLMWNDWSKDVRTSAARALGRTGNGKLVHDKLRERLVNGNETEKLDALRKIAFLGIMTGRLLPAFLECLRSDYISIRLEAVMTVAAIRLSHEEVLSELLKLANEERNWKVKAHCIKAIGLVAKPTEDVQEILLWCLRYEKEAAIRAEASQAIRILQLNSERVVSILQDRMVVEEDEMVQRDVAVTLNEFGLEPTGDLTMINAIQNEVKRLCNRDDIANAIVNQDVKQKFEENRQKYLKMDEDDEVDANSRRASQAQEKSGTLGQRFDPILEGYKIRSQSKVSVPSIPDVPDSAIECDAQSNSDHSADSDTELFDTSYSFDDQTIASYSTATVL